MIQRDGGKDPSIQAPTRTKRIEAKAALGNISDSSYTGHGVHTPYTLYEYQSAWHASRTRKKSRHGLKRSVPSTLRHVQSTEKVYKASVLEGSCEARASQPFVRSGPFRADCRCCLRSFLVRIFASWRRRRQRQQLQLQLQRRRR